MAETYDRKLIIIHYRITLLSLSSRYHVQKARLRFLTLSVT
jgi:hypothetical protein